MQKLDVRGGGMEEPSKGLRRRMKSCESALREKLIGSSGWGQGADEGEGKKADTERKGGGSERRTAAHRHLQELTEGKEQREERLGPKKARRRIRGGRGRFYKGGKRNTNKSGKIAEQEEEER